MAVANVIKKDIDSIPRQDVPPLLFEFIDTLLKIRKFDRVIEVCFAKQMTDIYVVTEEDDVDLSEKIMKKFAGWEASYMLFPELHIINKDEKFYIPDGANCL